MCKPRRKKGERWKNGKGRAELVLAIAMDDDHPSKFAGAAEQSKIAWFRVGSWLT
jgi:hypothetical protein